MVHCPHLDFPLLLCTPPVEEPLSSCPYGGITLPSTNSFPGVIVFPSSSSCFFPPSLVVRWPAITFYFVIPSFPVLGSVFPAGLFSFAHHSTSRCKDPFGLFFSNRFFLPLYTLITPPYSLFSTGFSPFFRAISHCCLQRNA